MRYFVIFISAIITMAVPARAEQVTANPEMIAEILSDSGYKAKIVRNDGDTLIESGSGGYKFIIFFYGCEQKNACESLNFVAGFTLEDGNVSLDHINDWNRRHRFGRAYLDGEMDPVIDMDLSLEEGVMSKALFKEYLDYWDTVVMAFGHHIFIDK